MARRRNGAVRALTRGGDMHGVAIPVSRPSARRCRLCQRLLLSPPRFKVMTEKGVHDMQVIIRFSVDGEKNGSLRNKLAGILTQAGFQRSGNTATYRHDHIEPTGIAAALEKFWSGAAKHKGNGRIDHFWMYSDRGFLDDIVGDGVGVDAQPEE